VAKHLDIINPYHPRPELILSGRAVCPFTANKGSPRSCQQCMEQLLSLVERDPEVEAVNTCAACNTSINATVRWLLS
jgi:hypothetical protein